MNKLKRIIGFVLAFTVLISSVYISNFNIFADEGIIYWDGSIKAPSVGSGTEKDPYIISEPAHFADMMKNVRGQNVYYKLTSNIYLNDISKINWTTGEAENGYDINTWTPSAFRGYIDGDGYSVYGLYINRKPSSYADNNTNGTGAGLLTENWGSAIVDFKNLGMDYIYIDSPNASAAFVARQNKGTINFDGCYLGENVFIKGHSAGGFVGYGGTTTVIIKNSYCTTPAENIVAVGNAAKSGAFLGDVWTENTKSISNSYSVARLYGNQKPKGSNSNLTSCYSSVQKSGSDGVKILTITQMQGSSAAVNMVAIGFESGAFVVTNGYPALKIFQKYTTNLHISDSETQSVKLFDWDTFAELDIPSREGLIFQGFFADAALTQSVQVDDKVKNYSDIYVKWREAPLDAKVWNGAVKEPTADSDDDGYIDIIYPSELAWVISNDAEGKYELNDDIYLNDITVDAQSGTYINNSQYEPLQWYTKADKAFSGEINGNGHIVYGLFYDNGNETELSAGLVPSVKKATIKNIGVDNSYIVQNSQFRVGAVVGTVHEADEVVIEECFVGENVYLEGTKIGGITGGGAPINVNKTVRVTIKNCYSMANINATQYGGIVGNLWSSYNRYYITGCYSSSRFSEGTSDLGNSSGNYAVGQEDGNRITKLTADDMQGALAEEKMYALFGENSAYMTTFGYPELRVFHDNIVEYYISATEKVHLGVSDTFTVGELEKPVKLGFTFDGFYIDAEYENKADNTAFVKDYRAIYVKFNQITKGDKVYNTYDYEGATFNKIEQSDSRASEGGTGNYFGTKSNMTASMENGQLSQFDAWVEEGTGVGESNGLKVTRARGYTWQWPTAVMLYDFDGSSFVPEKNSYYKISLKYKLSSLKAGKQIKIQLRQTVNGKVNEKYDNISEYGLINQRRLDSNFVSDGWVNTSFKFATGEDVEALFLAFTTDNNVWYAEELELYIDDIVIEKITESQMNEEYISPDSKNTYDETDASFTKIRQSDTTEFYGTISNINAFTENGQLSAYNAWVESGVGVGGSNALKVVRAEGYENRWPAAVMLYDSNFNSFVPETDSYYKLTLKYKVKSLKEGKQIKIQLRQTVNDKISEYYENVVEYGTVNQKIIDNYSVSDNWVETTFKFATDSDVEALFLAFTTENNKYWAEELELYIDDISIDKITEEEMYEAYVSPDSKNTYDEKDITYTKIEQTDKRDYSVDGNFLCTKSNMGVATEHGRFSQYDAFVEKGVGVNSGNALKVIRAHGYEKQYPTAVMLYDSNYNGFTPKANSYYQIKLKYKVDSLKDGKLVNIRLRQKVDGKVNVPYENIVEYGTVNRKNIDIFAVKEGWIETSFTFATNSQIDELYLAITSDNNQYWAEELELYIDDIEIKEITKDEMVDYSADGSYVSANSKNTYDEEDAKFIKIEQKDNRDYGVDGKFYATKSNMSAKTENGLFSQYDAWVESGVGVAGSNALKVIRAHGYEKQWPAAVMLYDNDFNNFVPKSNSFYQISLKYKVASLKEGKQVRLQLRGMVDGKVNVPYENIVEYGTINKKIIDDSSVSDNWIETTFKFTTEDKAEALYIAVTSNNEKWWAEELELYIDDIEIRQINEDEYNEPYVSPDSKNTYDEEDITYTKFKQTDKRDYSVEGNFLGTKSNMGVVSEHGRFSQYDAFVEKGVGVDGTNALKVVRAHGYEKQYPTAVMLYDSNYNGFTPKANSYYQISLKYRLESLKEGKQVRIQLRQKVDGKVNVKYENVVDYGRVNEKTIDTTCVSDKWVETTFKFVTGAEVDELFLAFTTENYKYWAEELELYVDDISIKQISYEEMGFDEGVKGRIWSGKVAMNYAGGKGTETEPYLIETPEQLAKCVSDATTTKTYYKVIADLKLNDTSSDDWAKTAKEWIYDSENNLVFRGHIDGDGHIVSGLYYNSTNGDIECGALFPRAAGDAVIEKLGIINSSVTVKNGQEQSYGAAFIAFVESYTENGVAVGPKLSQCFADDTVNVESYYAGGLVCGVASYAPTTLENCYFTGSIFGNGSMGTLFGNSWTSDRNFSTITNCYASSPDRNRMITNNGIKTTNYTNVYIDSAADSPRPNGVTYTLLKFMKGDEAKTLMEGFDFEKIWKIIPDGTPVLRVFESDDYSCTREPSKVAIQFNSNGGSKCETIYGEAREKLPELPIPTKYGYKFDGWYYFFELDVPCELDVFPDFNTILYAKWIPLGFTVDFEGSYDAVYDFNTSVQHHKPGSTGYRPMYNRNGMKSMQCMESTEINPVFLLSYENKLEVGKEYEMTVWVNTATKDVVGNVEFLFADYPDISAPTVVSEAVINVSDISSNKWTEKKVKFVAQSPYVFFKTPLNTTLYFDDIQVVPTGEDGKVDALSDGIANTVIVFIIVGSVILLGGIATLMIVIIKKRRKTVR